MSTSSLAHPESPPAGAELVDSVLADITTPPGWRILRTAGRLEARWSSPAGSWAAFSARLSEPPAQASKPAIAMSHLVGGAPLSVEFSVSDLGPDTQGAADALLTAITGAISAESTRRLTE